jgi:hypothetical protein
MQPIITKQLLDAAGVVVKAEDEQALIDHLNETLEDRVGAEVVESLDDKQLDELATLQESDDQEAIQSWMQKNVPEMEDIVKDEIDILLGEVAKDADNFSKV